MVTNRFMGKQWLRRAMGLASCLWLASSLGASTPGTAAAQNAGAKADSVTPASTVAAPASANPAPGAEVPQVKIERPFLVVRSSQFESLQALASSEPWASLKKDAIEYCKATEAASNLTVIADLTSAASLAYIVDPPQRSLYVKRLRDSLLRWGEFGESGPLQGRAFFNSVIALDIIYNDLERFEREDIEARLSKIGEAYWTREDSAWKLNIHACRGVWALYKQDRARIDRARKDYKQALLELTSPDGVGYDGPAAAGLRMSHWREAQAHFIDVLEFTGEDKLYSDPQLVKFFEWLYGYSITPMKGSYVFGDSIADANALTGSPLWRAHRFSRLAGRLAAWSRAASPTQGRLLSYLYAGKAEQFEPDSPTSRIFPDGGAWFLQRSNKPEALAGVLWNPRASAPSSHKDVNSVNLIAHGQHLLRNVGFVAPGQGMFSFSAKYISNEAPSNNTVLIDGVDHRLKHGAGIVDGITTASFDYACGDSGEALPNGKHFRSLLFVHPSDAAPGYWLLIDEIQGAPKAKQFTLNLHPNSADTKIVKPSQEYLCEVGPAKLTMFLASAPVESQLKYGLIANGPRRERTFTAKYLQLTYDLDSKGRGLAMTALLPQDASTARLAVDRLSSQGSQLALSLSGPKSRDVVMNSGGDAVVREGEVSFQAKTAFWREASGRVAFYFARAATSFEAGPPGARVGFSSNKPVSLSMQGDEGAVSASEPAKVRILRSGVKEVWLSGAKLAAFVPTADGVEFDVPSGSHEIILKAGK